MKEKIGTKNQKPKIIDITEQDENKNVTNEPKKKPMIEELDWIGAKYILIFNGYSNSNSYI